MTRHSRQLALHLPTWGGLRSGAGRKPKGDKPLVSHAARPKLDPRIPVHVVLRVVAGLPSLRGRAPFAEVKSAFAAGAERLGIRLTHFAVLGNHIHLLVEAENERALSRGIQGLVVRIAKGVNRALRRSGRVFSDHYFAYQLRTPSEVRRAVRYVVHNHALHEERAGRPVPPGYRDPFSSAAPTAPVVSPRTWLLRIGWRRARAGPHWEDRIPL